MSRPLAQLPLPIVPLIRPSSLILNHCAESELTPLHEPPHAARYTVYGPGKCVHCE
jgi:hypothetical protein